MTEELRAQLMGVKLTKKEKLIAELFWIILQKHVSSHRRKSQDACKSATPLSFASPAHWGIQASWISSGASAKLIQSVSTAFLTTSPFRLKD